MRGTRAKKIRHMIDELIRTDVITTDQRKNAERFFKRAWKNGRWKELQEVTSGDIDDGI